MTLTNLVKSYNIFTEAEIEKIRNAFVNVTFDNYEFLLRRGEISDKTFFIEEGILREFSFLDADADADADSRDAYAKTLTHWILGEQEWIYQVESYILQKPSDCYIQAISPLKACYIQRETLESLLMELPLLGLVILKIYQKYLLQLEHRNGFHRIKSAGRRLEVFEKMQPNLQNRIAGKILASYLNISPEQLSRLRTKRSKKR